jgi:hypothetical protein
MLSLHSLASACVLVSSSAVRRCDAAGDTGLWAVGGTTCNAVRFYLCCWIVVPRPFNFLQLPQD